jgi:tetratricopeptide (TPR) repeat protein
LPPVILRPADALRKDVNMAMERLLAMVCAGLVAAAPADTPTSQAPDNRDQVIAANLAVQTALQEGKELLLHGNYRSAVAVLESQLTQINGNVIYLRTLQDAYRKYIRELRLGKQDEEAQRYLRRLLILDRGAVLDESVLGTKAAVKTPEQSANGTPTDSGATFRLKGADAAPGIGVERARAARQADELLVRAEREFADRHYKEARLLYEQANQADRAVVEPAHERWAYCKLFHVADQVNHAQTAPPSWGDLEQEVQQALRLAPKLDQFGQSVLLEIDKNRKSVSAESARRDPALQHHPRNSEGWQIAESENFRIFHNQARDVAERAAEIAERTRVDVEMKWFSGVSGPWNPKCDLYLHADGEQYSRMTGQYNSPGHSSIRIENGRVAVRRIDLHCDDPNMLAAVLPHETTHVVLAGEFSGQLLPRWADEGLAVLTEPRAKVERHLDNLRRSRQEGRLFALQDLLQMENYPDNPGMIGAFYAESVSLVDFLSTLRGPQEFTLFLRDGLRYGYARSLERHYSLTSFADLERRWQEHAFQRPRLAQGQ